MRRTREMHRVGPLCWWAPQHRHWDKSWWKPAGRMWMTRKREEGRANGLVVYLPGRRYAMIGWANRTHPLRGWS